MPAGAFVLFCFLLLIAGFIPSANSFQTTTTAAAAPGRQQFGGTSRLLLVSEDIPTGRRQGRGPRYQRPVSSSRPNTENNNNNNSNNGHHHRRTTELRSATVAAAAASTTFLTTVATVLDGFWKTSPYAAAAIVCGFKASAADLVAQKRQYRLRNDGGGGGGKAGAATAAAAAAVVKQSDDNSADMKRNLAYVLYGAVYQGMAQEFIYNHLYPVWFGTGAGVFVVMKKVLFDLCVQTTMVTLPIAYLTKAFIFRYSVREGFRRYFDDVRNHGLLYKYYGLWGPVQCLTFSVVPEHLRVTFIAFVSFFWLIILSSIASKLRPAAPTAATQPPPSSSVGISFDDDDDDAVVYVEDCSLEDGLTCNIDG